MRSATGPHSARRRLRALRRRVLAHRRLLAAVLAGVAVLAAVRAASPDSAGHVEVEVAARDLPAGIVLSSDDLASETLPRGVAPAGLAEDPVGRVLAAPLGRGEVVTDVRLVGPALAVAQPGEVALPLRLPDAGMAALLRVGDRIDLHATDPGTGHARVVARDVVVLATPRGLPEGPAGTGGGAIVVVSVTAADSLEVTGASLGQFLTVAYSG